MFFSATLFEVHVLSSCFNSKFVCSDEEEDDEDDDEEEDIEESPVKARLFSGCSIVCVGVVTYIACRYRPKQHRPNGNLRLRMERVPNPTPPHRSR